MFPSEKDPVYGTFIKTYYDNLVSLNNDGVVTLVCIQGKSKGLVDKTVKYIVFYLEILYHLFCKSYDIVYVQTITTTIPPIKLVSLFRNNRFVFNVHGSDVITITKSNERLKRMAIPLLYKARLIVAPSEYFKSVLKEMLPDIPDSKIYVSPSGGVDLDRFYPFEIHNKVFTIGFVSRIDAGKGWDTFITALSLLKKNGFTFRGIIIGRGAEQDKMLRMMEEYNMLDIVEYVGPVPHDELPRMFCQFDVFVFPTRRSESLGLVGVEAMACGAPVIGSNYAALPEYISEGVNGFLFNHKSSYDLYKKLVKYIGLSKSEKETMSLNARNSSLKYESIVVMKSLYEKLKEIQ